jgi:3-oxoacyl-[acyl-carrier-protein] synthase III
MSKMIKIIGVGSYVPERILTNFDLEKMVDTSDEWIQTRTGMRERRIAHENEFTSSMGVKAALLALEYSGLSAEEIDFIIVATSTPDYLALSTACLIQHSIGAVRASSMDIQAACSGYLYALAIAKSFIESGTYKNILVVASEKLSSFVNYKDRSTCVLFGDGAAACVVCESEKKGLVLQNLCLGSEGEHSALGNIPAGGCRTPASHESVDSHLHSIHMSGSEIFKHAVRKMESACRQSLELSSLKGSDIRWLIPHQANMRIIETMAKRLEMPMERIYMTIHKYGNTSASSIGIALDECVRSQKLTDGDNILLTAFGFGLTWGAALLSYHNGK